jgi:ribosomal protein S18 acetylase RimI-like enzyme
MLKSLKNFSNGKITKLIENNFLELVKFFGTSSNFELIEKNNMVKFFSIVPLPYFNSMVYYDFNFLTVEKELKNFIQNGKSRKIPLRWLINPSCKPKNIKNLLENHHFSYYSKMIGMAIDNKDLNNCSNNFSEMEIIPVDNQAKLKNWVLIFLNSFCGNDKYFKTMYASEKSLGYNKNLPFLRFIGLMDKKAVSISAIFLGSEAAGLENVTTLPEWRRKGIGAIMACHAINFAQSSGYNISVLWSTDMGFNLYKNLGFKQYTELKRYDWEYKN